MAGLSAQAVIGLILAYIGGKKLMPTMFTTAEGAPIAKQEMIPGLSVTAALGIVAAVASGKNPLGIMLGVAGSLGVLSSVAGSVTEGLGTVTDMFPANAADISGLADSLSITNTGCTDFLTAFDNNLPYDIGTLCVDLGVTIPDGVSTVIDPAFLDTGEGLRLFSENNLTAGTDELSKNFISELANAPAQAAEIFKMSDIFSEVGKGITGISSSITGYSDFNSAYKDLSAVAKPVLETMPLVLAGMLAINKNSPLLAAAAIAPLVASPSFANLTTKINETVTEWITPYTPPDP